MLFFKDNKPEIAELKLKIRDIEHHLEKLADKLQSLRFYCYSKKVTIPDVEEEKEQLSPYGYVLSEK